MNDTSVAIARRLACAAAVVLAACSGAPGKDGEPCTVVRNADGTSTISCPDGTQVTVTNGQNGQNGQNGAEGAVGQTGQTGATGSTGQSGVSCSVSSNPDAGTRTITCTDGTVATVSNGANGTSCTLGTSDSGVRILSCTDGTTTAVPSSTVTWSTLTAAEIATLDLKVTVASITNAARPVVSFTVVDAKGNGVRGIPAANFSGIALLQLVPGGAANGLGNDTWISHLANCASCTAGSETASASSLADLGDGSYRYTFQKDIIAATALSDGGTAVAGVAFDANAVHKFGLRLAASGNPFRPVDVVYEYVPATGATVTGQNDKVSTAACLACHMQWRANANNAGGTVPFHGGQRYEVQYCFVCHNDQRKYLGSSAGGNPVIGEPVIDGTGNMTPTTQPTADGGVRSNVPVIQGEAVIHLPVFVHKIHRGHELYLKGPYAGLGEEMNEIAFPQNVSNCATCHKNATQANNWMTKPSRRACGACHDQVDFATGVGHLGGSYTDDLTCAISACHTPAKVAARHLPVEPPDPKNSKAGGTSSNTHASYLGIGSNPPPGVEVFRYDLPSTGVTVLDGGRDASDAGLIYRPVVKFKLLRADGGSVVFNTWDGGNELLDGFIGSPSAYCVFAMPQDGNADPADFNASASVWLRNAWRGSGATMTGPDSSGYYTVTMTGAVVPEAAKMLTCGLGYSYSLSSTMPLTQVDSGYPYMPMTDGGYGGVGGIAVPPLNVWQVAQGYTGRRGAVSTKVATGRVVDPAKCNNCHNQLGVGPSFHGGQRNEGSSCSWCHNPNRTSAGWSAGAGSYIHGIHGAGKRTVPFNWYALSAEEGFYKVGFPGRPQMCEGCHNAGMYDFSGSWYTQANQDRRLFQTVAQGKYNPNPLLPDGGVNAISWRLSPYIVADNTTDYGAGYAYFLDAGTPSVVDAAPTTLVTSPITNSCAGCHDSPQAILHMRANGAAFYTPRSAAVGAGATTREQCLICHGPGKVAAIREMHYQ